MFAAVVLLWAFNANAQSRYKKLCDKNDSQLCAQAVVAGELVPFDGQLLTTKMAVQQSQKANWCDARSEAAVVHAVTRGEERLKFEQSLRAIDARGYQQQIDRVLKDNEKLRQAAEVPFYRAPAFVAAITVVLTIAAFWAVAEMQQAVVQ